MKKYNHQKIEPKWQKFWDEKSTYRAFDPKETDKQKYYCLIEFPYPSGEGLHVGHPRSYTAIDVIARKKRMDSYNVLFPIGWDAFGLPTENYAIKTGIHPRIATLQNVKRFKKQIKSLGLSFDWSREINTTEPEYYKWTQWIFLKLFENGLAYKKKMPINWCPSCKIGLANEEVVEGACERCGHEVEKRNMEQWLLKITAYADRLIEDLETVDYLERIKNAQINWIGRSYGADVEFEVKDSDKKIKVFTTRPDTLFGATYMVLSPEHKLVKEITTKKQKEKVVKYQKAAKKKSDMERTELAKEKTGVFTGSYAINPVNGEEIPIWVADYVLATYGYGAIMAVPAHDERDFEFAKKYDMAIVPVIIPVLEKDKKEIKIEKIFDVVKKVNEALEKNNIKVWFNGTIGVIGYYGKVFSKPADVDCGVLIKDFKKAREIIEKLGYKLKEEKHNEKFDVAIYEKDKIVLEIGTFDHDLGDNVAEVGGIKYPIPDAAWFAECYRITAPKDRRKGENDLDRARFLEAISGTMKEAFTEVENGKMINSDFLNDLIAKEAIGKITSWIEEKGLGKSAVNYKLRDWIFSRQHYWGEPIPIVFCKSCGTVPVPFEDLPLKLPKVDNYKPTDTGESPLADIKDWVNTKCPTCGGKAKRETDTMPNWAGSSWYFLRYCDPKNNKEFASIDKLKYWMPVDLYNGGMEHTTLHLLYSRFWHKFLYDLGFVPTSEPYTQRRSHGMILGEDGQKMSKSRGNVINPDDIVEEFGADVLRTYEMFMGPYDQAIAWSTSGIKGVRRFIDRIYNFKGFKNNGTKDTDEVEILVHKTIKKVTADIDKMHFNTAISALMILLNKFEDEKVVSKDSWKIFLTLLSPFAPHLAEELWQELGKKTSICTQAWPKYDESKIKEEKIKLVVQVNGKLRATLEVESGITEDEAKELALKEDKVKKAIGDKKTKKVVFVKDRLINFVVK